MEAIKENIPLSPEFKGETFKRFVESLTLKDYLLYDIDDYMIDELANYVDEEDMTENDILYDEMLEEVRNRDIEIDNEMIDSEKYYKILDEEAKYYEYVE
jgi:hypothetical protein